MEDILPGKTDRESQQYLKDRGHRVAIAQAYRYLGRLIETDDSYPLPPGSETVIATAATAMQDIATARQASIEAYAHQRREAIREAASSTLASIRGAA